MDIIKATLKYESWLAENTIVIQSELDLKHKNMAENPFSFFRAVFYRWIQLFNNNFDNLNSVPSVLGVGDRILKTSEHGEMPKEDLCGESMTSMELIISLIQMI